MNAVNTNPEIKDFIMNNTKAYLTPVILEIHRVDAA